MRVLLDILIGWNQGAAERAEARAMRARTREARFRAEYEHRFPNPWRRA